MSPRDEPTPEQAARALRELTARRHQALRVHSPRWQWWLGGVLFLALGFAEDLFPRAAWAIDLAAIALLLILAVSGRYRPIGAALGYRASVRGSPPAGVAAVRYGGQVAILTVEFVLHRISDQTHFRWDHTLTGVVVGPLLALGMPWAIEQAYRQHGELAHDGG